MANYCSNRITATATDSEWKEISQAFEDDLIDWPLSMDGTDCSDWNKEILCTTKWSPTPWNEGHMENLSESYPSVLFHYVTDIEGEYRSPSAWFCNGREGNRSEAEQCHRQAQRKTADRFLAATKQAGEGVFHRVEIMPDGRVAADGENRFGECDILCWSDIRQISCGNWHTVGLRADGALVACGSNANGQCHVSDLPQKAIAVSCGRYHTAILLEDGKVMIRGKLEQALSTDKAPKESPKTKPAYPREEAIRLDKTIPGWEKMNLRIAAMTPGKEVVLKKNIKDGVLRFDVINMRGEKLGELYTDDSKQLSAMLRNLKVTVGTVTPLSDLPQGSQYAAMTLRLQLLDPNAAAQTAVSTIPGEYSQTRVDTWPAVRSILSVFDAVMGVTEQGEYFIDGFCPCSEADLIRIAKTL